jgi:processive 1,2-diacylglycerol beta-glucosyltransferase
MKICTKIQLICLITLSTALALILATNSDELPAMQTQPQAPHKKILILSSLGGGAHKVASGTLETLFNKEYSVKTIFPINSLLSQYDPIKQITNNKYSGEDFYNKLLQEGWINSINLMSFYFGPSLIFAKTKKLERKFLEIYLEEKPDIIISVIPLLNLAAKNAADRLKIPYILISLDMDLSLWAKGLKEISTENFLMTVCDEFAKQSIAKKLERFKPEQIKIIGMPTKPDFLKERTEKEKDAIKKEWNIPSNKFTVLLMMGSTGSEILITYAKKLSQLDLPIHVLVCRGRLAELDKELQPIIVEANAQTSFTIVPFTPKIADLMSVSDVFITKAGGLSFNEARTMKLPMLIEKTQATLYLEQGVINYVQEKGLGRTIKKFRHLNEILKNFLNKQYYENFKKAFDKLPKNNFNNEIIEIVHKMCPLNTL